MMARPAEPTCPLGAPSESLSRSGRANAHYSGRLALCAEDVASKGLPILSISNSGRKGELTRMSKPSRSKPAPPPGFQIVRSVAPGRHRLLQVFPGLDQLTAFRRYPVSEKARQNLARRTEVEIIPRPGEFMYVAPHALPKDADPRWKPIVSATDCIVIGDEHLKRSPEMVLFLDIIHEIIHLLQRQNGRELWDDDYSYVDRPTELEAYAFTMGEARRLGAMPAFLREYLKVEWTTSAQHRRLLLNLNGYLSAPDSRRRPVSSSRR